MNYSQAKLQELARKDHERILLEEAKNKYESSFYSIRSKLSEDDEELSLVSTEEQRSEVLKMAEDAEDWMYYEGGDTADLETYEKRYEELMAPAQAIFTRLAEYTARPEAIKALNAKLAQIEELMTKWETSKPQVTEDERTSVLDKVSNVRKWVADLEEEQAGKELWEEPAFLSTDVPKQTKSVETLIGKLSKKPKPKPEKKKETETNSTDSSAEDDSEAKEEKVMDDEETSDEGRKDDEEL